MKNFPYLNIHVSEIKEVEYDMHGEKDLKEIDKYVDEDIRLNIEKESEKAF